VQLPLPRETTVQENDMATSSRTARATRRAMVEMLAVAVPAAVAGCATQAPSTLTPAGPGAATVAGLWWMLFAISVVVCVVVIALVVLAAVRRRRDGTRVQPGRGGTFVLVLGIVLPAIVLTGVYAVGLRDMRALAEPPAAPAATVEVVGHIWWWEVRYPDQGIVTANEIHVPAGQPVRLQLRTADVNHSFWVPELMPKTDLVAGRVNETWLQADHPGTYRGQCAEYCGLQHAHMAFTVVADPPDRFAAWVAQERRPAAAPADPLAARGRTVLETTACASCHAVAGTAANGQVGPNLTHVASRERLAAEAIPNDTGHLAGWIANSQSVKPGNLMPPQPLAPEDLQAVVAYLQSLK
jgi:cytochrome c oxidase subunit 2